MKIGIMSDIHGYPEKFKKAVKCLKGADFILCAGDILYHGPRNPILEGYDPQGLACEIAKSHIPMLTARGNCDAEVDLMVLDIPLFTPAVVYEKDGTRFMAMHGHDVSEDQLDHIADTYNVNIMITGHTHIRKCEQHQGVLFINPGSIGVPKGDGIASVAVYEDGRLDFINIDNGEIISTYTYERSR